ncbi:PepSY domain-containing protein [Azospirillum brasilense]|uniref:PepSY domain-containing protein n=1 Tax=Azospirillum brasilense TaxID=192 RepID=UPI000E6901E2|nr:PepSY domain-containing protein [Azospirillum brasilense]NUB24829.1 peptidase [Azospirillum brasilense]NUB35265.1 peptidase [Azospirillum brasilense]RIW04606.1 peptidase [Azospirillum brasilense]
MNAVRTALLSLILFTAALPGATLPAHADDDRDHERAREAFRSGRALPLEAIVARAQADFPGDILDVEFEDEDGQIVYEIKTITAEGRVLKLKYDAATGDLLRVRGRNGKGEGGHHGRR